MKKTAYIAAKVGQGEPEVHLLRDELIALGYSITFDWTQLDMAKPYAEHPIASKEAAQHMVESVSQADLFILVWNDNLVGGLIETGIALAYLLLQNHGDRKVYIVGSGKEKSAFFFLPNVYRFDTIQEVLHHLQSSR